MSAKAIRRKQLLRRTLAEAQGGLCHYCAQPFGDARLPTLDHTIPKCRGGETAAGNCVAACESCNNDKGELTQAEYLVLRERPEEMARVRQARGLLADGVMAAFQRQAPAPAAVPRPEPE